jgi:hypothetical protein
MIKALLTSLKINRYTHLGEPLKVDVLLPQCLSLVAVMSKKGTGAVILISAIDKIHLAGWR